MNFLRRNVIIPSKSNIKSPLYNLHNRCRTHIPSLTHNHTHHIQLFFQQFSMHGCFSSSNQLLPQHHQMSYKAIFTSVLPLSSKRSLKHATTIIPSPESPSNPQSILLSLHNLTPFAHLMTLYSQRPTSSPETHQTSTTALNSSLPTTFSHSIVLEEDDDDLYSGILTSSTTTISPLSSPIIFTSSLPALPTPSPPAEPFTPKIVFNSDGWECEAGTMKPLEPEPAMCCGNDCPNCIWIQYDDQMLDWKAAQHKKKT